MDFDNPPADPVAEVNKWLFEAQRPDRANPNAMTLATVDPDGRPSARIVLLKQLDDEGAVFYTSRISRKARALKANPHASLVLYWDPERRQVLIEGRVSTVDDGQCDAYFASRPREAQIGAWASEQSQPVESRAELDARVLEVAARYAGREIPRPSYWGGYRVSLDRIEFWQGRDARLHDRVAYTRNDQGGWSAQRLYP